MLNFFQYLNNILFTKNKKACFKENCSETLSGYMLNKWASFYDKQNCILINEFCNKSHITENSDLLSKFLLVFLPKKDYKKINYIKKIKEKENNSKQIISKNLELGSRDTDLILKHIEQEKIKKLLKIYETV